jgi:glycolate oxidase FAD binding subunit
MTEHRSSTLHEASEALRSASAEGATVRALGAGTKAEWGRVVSRPDVEIRTDRMNDVVEYNHADMTAVLGAGLRLASAQETFAANGQMLALDPPLGDEPGATIGGIFSTADSGPLRHRYGAARDLVLGMTVVLADGTIARAGGKVIKNVAGYDLAKLFTGSFGTLGLIAEVVVRLHPFSPIRVTARGSSEDPAALQRGAMAVSHAALQAECLDVGWREGRGSILARFAGPASTAQAEAATRLLSQAALDTTLIEDDESLWASQREGQRAAEGAILRLSGLQGDLARVLRAADSRAAHVVGRAGAGVHWLRLPHDSEDRLVEAVDDLRAELRGVPCVVRDAPRAVREKVDVWGEQSETLSKLSRSIKQRFDPDGLLNPGIFVGGI